MISTDTALRQLNETGSKYPLIVKLGTISADSADVFSYAPDEDSTVIDPKLPEHLARFGIETQQLRKTERSTNELAIDLNCKYDWASLTASAAEQQQQQQRGAGFALFSIPRFGEKFLRMYEPLICCQGLPSAAAAAAGGGPGRNLSLQLGALSVALQTRRVCMQKALGMALLQKALRQKDVQIDEKQLINGMLFHLLLLPLLLLVFEGDGVSASICCSSSGCCRSSQGDSAPSRCC
ncbi:ubiquitin carboxyl-terminal hydrolase, putative [Eimeria mitis]|uniref:Ubiquitin carboxyl-terminal hydrolase, putative n=1 Tax=Eimeria mitis TaxID=44415 RepID=U6KKF7_9EIME|nr:ubiquitin carboxyl-terminal hydrolase, putative [Eimeria mitis]CDJ36762.1 ubiquitin carboxyl-terminal hydrolase, putative [Eimeria mitis]